MEAVADILWRLPFKPITFNSDNGNEFINKELHNYICKDQKINFTRSRAYKKNDNAHVEQKSFTHVREIFGYERLENNFLAEEMNEIYKKYFNVLQNFFIPQIKTKELTRVVSKYIRKCDAGYSLSEINGFKRPIHSKKIELKKRYDALNPILLKRELDAARSRFNRNLFVIEANEEAA